VSALYGGLGTGLFSAISVSFFVWLGIDSENSVMTSVILLVVIFVAVTAFVACLTAFALANTNFDFTACTSHAGFRTSLGMFSTIPVSFCVWLGIDSENSVMTSVILLVVIFVAVTAFVACITAFALVNTNFNFTARTSDAVVRISSSMLSTTSNTIPPGRIQA